ncbi:MAG: DUF6064 family protein [Anaerolineae bacterium]|jgi:hypothetical protein
MANAELFWTQVATYNETLWPAVILMTIVAAFLACRVFFRPGAETDTWIKAFLSFAFAWNGIVFFLIFQKNPISMFAGAPLFIILSLLFAADIRTRRTQFRPPGAAWKKGVTVFWLVLVFLYPLIGWPLGHVYPKTLLPMFPCPLTVFAIALVAAAAPNVDKKILVLLLPWALMALPKCFGVLDCYEDCILFAAGVYGLVELIRNWKTGGAGIGQESLLQHKATD